MVILRILLLAFALTGCAQSPPLEASATEKSGERQCRASDYQAQQPHLQSRPKKDTGTLNGQAESEHTSAKNTSIGNSNSVDTEKELARLEREIEKYTAEYNKASRTKFLGTHPKEDRFAKYAEGWRKKVERYGTAHFPETAQGRRYGSLIVSVTLKADGSLAEVPVIEKSSGDKVLDATTVRLLQSASPYAPFPTEILPDTDFIVITRTLNFERGEKVSP